MDDTHDKDKLSAFQKLVDTYESALLRYVAKLTGNPSCAEDVVQNTFIKFIRKWEKGLEVSSEVASWLYRVAHNEAVDHVRSEARIRKLHAEHGGECLSRPESGAAPEVTERAESAAQALARLPERERQLVILKVYEEKSYKEIAEITGLSVSNVGFILHTAMKKLAVMLRAGEAKK